ncbi:virion structural protein [Pseudomonas phage PhiPA3]|uniref:Virion structural protein n=1 Tax=Pseudomonas phage PhiPA3 TaxID=998086 RepID=F8SJQ2_BPPA3|nr:virion structural protein [Pseudomonas phage PhiPA3]AEH03447.1 virion structural protein [Pseudomonas phage PhiPA3]
MPTTPSNLVPVTVEEIRAALAVPIGYTRETIHRLFNISNNDPLPDTLKFFKQVEQANGYRYIAREPNSMTIGITLGDEAVTKANILAYIKKAAPNVIDLSPWATAET